MQNGSDGEYYYYVYNHQGDVVALLDSSLNYVANYTYDSWGKLVSVTGSNTTIGNLNPFRYRGYYYDSETGLYYLNSRYYNPEIGRFINADGYVQTGRGLLDKNMFAYCANNPVNNSDPYGHSFKKIWNSVGGFLGSIFGAGSSSSLTTINTKLVEFNLLSIVSFSSSVKTTKVVSKSGDSSKPISVYANRDAKHPVKSSSAGLKLNIGNTTYKASLGIDDIGVYKSTSNGKATQTLGIRINLSELKIGFDHVVSVQEDNDITNSISTNGSFNLFVAIGVVYYIATGKLPSRSPQESPQRSPQGSPINI